MALFGTRKTNKEDKSSDKLKSKANSAEAPTKKPTMQELYETPAPRSKTKSSKTSDSKTSDNNKTLVQNTNFNLAYKILIRPVITEKGTHLNALGKYIFVVGNQANKIAVAQAVEAVYGVKPIKVNIMNVSGKRVISKGIKGQRKDWRKAIVTLKKGESIKIYEGV